MTKLIVEMEMPKDCTVCKMAHWDKRDELTGCDVAKRKKHVSDNDEFWETGRPSWCPIKGVLPEKHGDLIDRDEIFHAAQPEGCTDEQWAKTTLGRVVLEAKAVIAAERSET